MSHPTSPYAAPAAAPQAAAVVPAAPALTPASSIGQVGFALGGILLLILLGGWLVKRLGFAPQRRNSALLKVAASCPVGQRERVVVVEVENTWLVLGVTAQQITTLHTLSAPPPAEDAAPAPAPFRQLLNTVLHRPDTRHD